jgi:hypothetical protein
MLAWHVPFLGWRRLPADLSEFEIAHFFTLKPVDIRTVRSRYKESLRLGAALQLGFLTMCGRPLISSAAIYAVRTSGLGYFSSWHAPVPAE